MSSVTTLLQHFSHLEDPRIDRTQRHSLDAILTIAICGVICGAEDWVAIERFGNAKLPFFQDLLDLPHGIPSHDTFGRVFAALDTDAFAQAFTAWVQSLVVDLGSEVVAIDGKTMRRTLDKANHKAAIHLVSAFAQANRLVLGQVKVNDKSNEITAIPVLLQRLALAGCLVTLDAMGCQKAIARDIVQAGADYLLALKANHGDTYEEVQNVLCPSRPRATTCPPPRLPPERRRRSWPGRGAHRPRPGRRLAQRSGRLARAEQPRARMCPAACRQHPHPGNPLLSLQPPGPGGGTGRSGDPRPLEHREQPALEPGHRV